MNQGISVIVYRVKDLARAKAIYGAFLGVEPYADMPYYVGFRVGDQEVGLNPDGHHEGMTGPVSFVTVEDIQQSLQALLDAGAQTRQEVKECRWRQADRNRGGRRWERHRARTGAVRTRWTRRLPAARRNLGRRAVVPAP